MPDKPIDTTDVRVPHANMICGVLSDYSNGAITTDTSTREWVIGRYARILQVLVDSETANSGNGVDRIDINVNGTSIYSATADKPVLQPGDTGMWTASYNPATQDLLPLDIVSYDVDNVADIAGSARVKVCIILGAR